jgi:HK97 family phage major capsid protein
MATALGLERSKLLARAASLLDKPTLTKEDKSRFDALLALVAQTSEDAGRNDRALMAERLHRAGEPRRWFIDSTEETRAFDAYIHGRKQELRDLGVTSEGGFLAPQDFIFRVFESMRATDNLFSPDVVTAVEILTGIGVPIPLSDDTANAAILASESAAGVETDPGLGSLVLTPLTWRSGRVICSLGLTQDSAFDLDGYLSQKFAVRFARGIGPANVAALIAGAQQGAVATGDPNNHAVNGTNSVRRSPGSAGVAVRV